VPSHHRVRHTRRVALTLVVGLGALIVIEAL
jgi:hypothetical protein